MVGVDEGHHALLQGVSWGGVHEVWDGDERGLASWVVGNAGLLCYARRHEGRYFATARPVAAPAVVVGRKLSRGLTS